MESLMILLEQQKNYKEFLKKTCRKNKINLDTASFFTPIKFKALYERLLRNYETKQRGQSTNWAQNELKAFHWLLVVNSALKERLVQNFQEDDWNLMSGIFLNKDKSVLKYEGIKLVNQRVTKNRIWSEQQTQLLTQIIKQNQFNNKWNDIARKLFQKSSDLYFRSGKQCRQRWLNHLDPNKKRGQWEEEEDKIIIKYIFNHGRRWSHIAKQLGGQRTQHMVKNRFKTLIIKQKKITPKIHSETSLLKQIGSRLFGPEEILIKKQVNIIEQDDHSMIQQCQLAKNEQNFNIAEKKQLRKTEVIIPPPTEQIKEKAKQNEFLENHVSLQGKEDQEIMQDPILPQIMQDCVKGMNSVVSTPNYEMQQIYSPYYVSYRGVTPYLSPSPSMSYFVNSSFSAFDNAFTQNMFICPTFANNPNENSGFNQ